MARRSKKAPPPTIVTLEHGSSRADILLRAGGTVASIVLDGREALDARPLAEVQRDYEFRASLDTFAANIFFQSGFATPLFPVAGHLPAKPLGLDLGEAEIDGRRLPVPLNLNREHWNGLAYLKRAEIVSAQPNAAHLRLPAGFFGPYWTGQVQLDLRYELTDQLRVEMKATNIGPTPSPVSAGVSVALREGFALRADPTRMISLETDASFTFTWRVTRA